MDFDSLLQLFIDYIALKLPLIEVAKIRILNKSYNALLSREGFWKNRIQQDLNINSKSEEQTWEQRYKFAGQMGSVFIMNWNPHNIQIEFDQGTPVSSSEIHSSIPHNINHRLLPYQAVSAVIIPPRIYYLTDQLYLYRVDTKNILLDKGVTAIGELCGLIYIKLGNLWHYRGNKHYQLTTNDNVVQMSTYGLSLSYVILKLKDGTQERTLRQMRYHPGSNRWSKTNLNIQNVLRVYHERDGLIFYLDAQRKLHTYPHMIYNDFDKFNIKRFYENVYITDENKILVSNKSFSEPTIKEIITSGVYVENLLIMTTTEGCVYYRNSKNTPLVKLNIKAKSVCPYSEYLVLIV